MPKENHSHLSKGKEVEIEKLESMSLYEVLGVEEDAEVDKIKVC
jgi:hypothetical protein